VADTRGVEEEGARGDRPARGARRRAAAAALVRAALSALDLGRPQDASAVVAALGVRRGARPEVVAAAARRLAEVLADPVIARARRSKWLGRAVPVAVEIAGRVQEDTLDLVFEESGKLVVVRFDDETGVPVAPLPATALAQALGRRVRETRTLSLTGP
jgi:hypothetical protein